MRNSGYLLRRILCIVGIIKCAILMYSDQERADVEQEEESIINVESIHDSYAKLYCNEKSGVNYFTLFEPMALILIPN